MYHQLFYHIIFDDLKMNKELERKLKRERVEACLNCKKFVKCDDIGKFEECVDFEEIEGDDVGDKENMMCFYL